MSSRNLPKRLLVAAVFALLTPVVLGSVLAGASVLADSGDTSALLAKAITSKPVTPPPPHRRTLSTLGRASAVAWIRIGHVGH
ncbi:MAG: hypothetical protein WDM86_23320 [Rhizomicrobium sp.]